MGQKLKFNHSGTTFGESFGFPKERFDELHSLLHEVIAGTTCVSESIESFWAKYERNELTIEEFMWSLFNMGRHFEDRYRRTHPLEYIDALFGTSF